MVFSKKKITVSILVIGSLLLVNYIPMLYNRILGNGGDYVEFFEYNTPNRNFLKKIDSIKSANDSSIFFGKEKGGYLHVIFFERLSRDNFHAWITSDTISERTTIVFYGVSKSRNKDSTEIIKKDFGLILRLYNIHRFSKFVLRKIE